MIKNVVKPLTKSVFITLGLTAAASAADSGMYKKILGSGATTLIILNDEIEDIIKIVKSLEDSGILLTGVSKTIQNEAKEQKEGFLCMLLGILSANLLENMLAGKAIITAGYDSEDLKSKGGKGMIGAGYGPKLGF